MPRRKPRSNLVPAVGLAGVALLGAGAVAYGLNIEVQAVLPDPASSPNILLITLCSVRADHIGAWGYSPAKTPTIDAIARGGARFANAWSSATFTLPSHVTVLTGRWPLHAGVLSATDPLPDDVPTLPEVLKHYGYRTIAWAPVASGASFRVGEGLERGFDRFIEGPSGGVEALAGTEPWFALVHFKDAHPPYSIFGERAIEVDPRIREWNDRRTSQELGSTADAWFLEQLQDPKLKQEVVDLYDRALGIEDDRIASVLAHVDLSRTVVVIAGDHGQALGEEAVGHQGILAPEVLHVPLVFHVPGGKARDIADDVGLVDIAPTLWELAGAVTPAGLDGRSLVPWLDGGSLAPRGVIAQAEVTGGPPWGGAQEVLVARPWWLRYSVLDKASATMRESEDGWTKVESDTAELLAERARLSGDAGVRTMRAATEAERAALRKEGYW